MITKSNAWVNSYICRQSCKLTNSLGIKIIIGESQDQSPKYIKESVITKHLNM